MKFLHYFLLYLSSVFHLSLTLQIYFFNQVRLNRQTRLWVVQVFHQVFANVWYSSDKFLDSMHGFLYIWHGLEFYWFDILYCKFNCLKTIISDTKLIQLTILHEIFSWFTLYTVLINIGTGRSALFSLASRSFRGITALFRPESSTFRAAIVIPSGVPVIKCYLPFILGHCKQLLCKS